MKLDRGSPHSRSLPVVPGRSFDSIVSLSSDRDLFRLTSFILGATASAETKHASDCFARSVNRRRSEGLVGSLSQAEPRGSEAHSYRAADPDH